MKLHLGIIYKDGKVINHRSLLKIVLNPLLRLFGWQIATKFDNEQIGGIVIMRCPRVWKNSWIFDATGCIVERKRIFI